MPEQKNQAEKLKDLPDGVLPAIDAVIAQGIVDPERVAVAGQSDGGFATIGLITETHRFRTAIESAGFCDLVIFYGTFYGQFRYGTQGSRRADKRCECCRWRRASIISAVRLG
ncbi:MAG TPA: prolyl oligopeptidase family serine peptidase [Candidatus Koribacter sp.]